MLNLVTRFGQVKDFVDHQQQREGRWIHVHCSTPCSSGSVLKRFSDSEVPTESDESWKGIIVSSEKYLCLADSRSFELPKRNDIWSREETVRVLHNTGLNHVADVYLCQTGLVGRDDIPVGKCLRFCSTSRSFAAHSLEGLGLVSVSSMPGCLMLIGKKRVFTMKL